MNLAVVNCSQLVTLGGSPGPRTGARMRELGVVNDGALLVREGRVQAAGKRADIEPIIPKDAAVVDAGGRIALPGFVDAHTHMVFAGNRAGEFERRIEGASYAGIAAEGGGIRSTVRLTREAGSEALLANAQRYEEWFLRGGVTTVEAKSGYGLSTEVELKILHVIRRLSHLRRLRYVATFMGAHEIPDEYRGRRGAYVDLIIQEMLPRVASEKLAEFCDVFCEPSVFPVEDARTILNVASALGLALRVHADQFEECGGAALAAEVGACTADHLEAAGEAGIHALAAAGVQPVLLPGSVYALGSRRYPEARAMIEAGLAVVLASDFNPGTSPTASMPMILSLATSQMRMTPAEAITAATVNAAYSIRKGSAIGSLEPGKQADFVIHDCSDYRELPYFFGRETAVSAYVGGTKIYPA